MTQCFPEISMPVNKQILNKKVRQASHGSFQDSGQAFVEKEPQAT
jgi:hypothetical protein